MIPKEVVAILKKTPFITVATSSLKGKPNANPKFFLNVGGGFIYFADYVGNRTERNLKTNPQAVISVINAKTLVGYRIFGRVKLLKDEAESRRMISLFKKKVIDLTVERVITAVRSGIKTENYEISLPAKIVIYKLKVSEITIISPTGNVVKDQLGKVKLSVKNPDLSTALVTKARPLLVPSDLNKVKDDLTVG